MTKSNTLDETYLKPRRNEKMREEMLLRIMELKDGRWKFDIKTQMTDDELQRLIKRLNYVEHRLKQSMKTERIKVSDTIEFVQKRKEF